LRWKIWSEIDWFILDGYIILDEYLSLQSNKKLADGLELFIQHSYGLGKFYFGLMDSTQKGVVAWSDFVLFYSCKLIVAKTKVNIFFVGICFFG
jgi:hypothetical protein